MGFFSRKPATPALDELDARVQNIADAYAQVQVGQMPQDFLDAVLQASSVQEFFRKAADEVGRDSTLDSTRSTASVYAGNYIDTFRPGSKRRAGDACADSLQAVMLGK